MKDLPLPEADDAEVERQIADILNAPEYDYTDPWYTPITSWVRDRVEDVFGWVARRIEDFFGLFGGISIGGVGGGGVLGQVLGYGIIAVAVLIIARLVWRSVQSRLPKPVSYRSEPVVDIDRWRSPKELLAEAEAFEAREQWDEALRARYRYVIAELVERKLIENPPGRTTGEYRTAVASRLSASAAGFSAITETFEEVWYGEVIANREMVDDLRRTGELVLETAKSRQPSGQGSADADRELVG